MTKEMLTMDRFGDIMDDYIHRTNVRMTVEKKENSSEWDYDVNIAGGPTVELFIALQVIECAYKRMVAQLDGILDSDKIDELGDGVAELVREALRK